MIPITFMTGLISAVFLFLSFILSLPGRDGKYHFELVYRVMPIYRCTLIVTVTFLSVATCIYMFRRYKVNWIFIFDFKPQNKLNEYQFFKIFIVLFAIWMACALGEILSINGYINSEKHISYYALTLVSIFTLLTINPFNCFYRKFRLELLYSLWLTVISPFGEVRFKDFFLGDVLTSAVKPLADVAFIGCYFTTD